MTYSTFTPIVGAKKGSGQPRKPNIAPDSAQSKTRIKLMYGLSEGEILGLVDGAKSIYLEDTPLHAENGSVNFENVKWQVRHGTNDQEYISGFEDISSEMAVGVELKQSRAWVKSFTNLELDAILVRMRFSALRTTNPDNGDVTGATVEYAIDVMTDGTAWVQYGTYKVSDKTSANYERSHRIELPKAEQGWQIRVRRLTPDSNSDYLSDKSFIQAYTEVIDAKLAYPNTALLALEYDAETFSNVAKMSAECYGVKIKVPSNYDPISRTYSGIWDGTFKIEYTNNPAWHFYDACINQRYALGDKIDSSMIDKWSIYRLGQYCDEMVSDGKGGKEPRFTLNVYEQSQDDAWSVLSKMAGAFRAYIYWDGQAIVCDADMPQDTYFTYTSANVIDGHFERSGTASYARHTVAKVAWNNPQNQYKTEYVMVRDEEAISKFGNKVVDIQAYGCTSESQAQRAGLWALKSEQLETQTITFKVGLDGYIPQPGKIIEVADPIFAGRANGGRVSSINSKKDQITLDRDNIICRAGDRLVINSNHGKAEARIIKHIQGRVVTVVAPFDNIAPEHIWVIDAQDLATMKYRVISITQDETHQFTITGLEYNPKKYDAIDYGTVVDNRPITLINPALQAPVERVEISATHMVQQGLNIATMVIAFPQVQGAVKYLVEWKKDDGNWIKLPVTGTNSVEVQGIYDGKYQARVTAISAFDMASLATYSVVTRLQGKAGKPPKLAKITATGTLFGMKLDWAFNAKSEDTAYTEIQVSPNGRANIATLGQFAYPTNKHEITGLQGSLTQFYRAKIVDKLGNESDWTDWTSGTTSANPQAVLDILQGQINESSLNNILTNKINTAVNDGKNNAQNLAQEIINRTNAIRAETTARTQAINTAIANEATNRTNAIRAETTARTQAINTALANEATNRTNAIRAETTARTQAINTEIATLNRAITTEISSLQNGLTQEIQQRKDGDNSTLTNLNAYKVSNDRAVANVVERVNVSVSDVASNASKINVLQSELNNVNNMLTTKASTTALNALTTCVTQQGSSITAISNDVRNLQSSISTVQSGLATKLDSSVISNYYTKAQADDKIQQITTGKIEEFNANLSIGGNNLIPESDKFRQGLSGNTANRQILNDGSLKITGATNRFYNFISQQADLALRNIHFKTGDSFIVSIWLKAVNPSQPPTEMPELYLSIDNTYKSNFEKTGSFENGGEVRYSQIRIANANRHLATPYVPHIEFSENAVGGGIIITKWQIQRGTKATDWTPALADTQAKFDVNAQAINTINSNVNNLNNTLTSQSQQLTQLRNDLTATNVNVSTKADATALNILDNRVTQQGNNITSQGSKITQLENSLNTVNQNLNTKASSTALSTLDSKVTTLNNTVNSQGQAITQLNNSLDSTNSNVSKKADATVLTALDNKVIQQGNNITTQSNKITQLENSLNTVNQNLNTKANASALTTLDSKVSGIDGRVSTQANQITQLTSNLSTNNNQTLDALKLSAMITNGKLLYVDVNFKQGLNGVVVYNNSGNGSVLHERIAKRSNNPTSSTHEIKIIRKANMTSSPNLGGFYQNIQSAPNKTFIVKYLICLPVGYYLNVASNATGNDRIDKFIGSTAGTGKYETYLRYIQCGDTGSFGTSGHVHVAGTAPTAEDLVWYLAQIECYEVTDYQSVDNTVQQWINNATSSLTTLTNQQQSQSQQLTNLHNALNSTNATVTTKADATALNTLNSRVTQTNDRITAESQKITALQNSLNTVNGTLNTKADSSALSTLDNRVTQQGNNITSQSNQITNLITRLDENNLCLNPSMKENNSGWSGTALRTLLNNEYVIELTNRDAYYISPYVSTANVGDKFFFRAKLKVKDSTHRMRVGLSGNYISNNGAFWLLSFVKSPSEASDWIDVSGYLTVPSNLKNVKLWCGNEKPANTSGNWYIKDVVFQRVDNILNALIDAKADSSALNNLVTNVTRNTESITSQGSKLTQLENNLNTFNQNLNTKASSTALSTLDSKVTALNNTVNSQGQAITQLNNSLNATNTNVSKKADATALTALDNKVTQQGNNITTQGSKITQLENSLNAVNQNINTKASSTALNTLDSKVTILNNTVNSQGQSITQLNNSLNATNTNISKKADTTALTALDNRVTQQGNNIISQANQITQLESNLNTVNQNLNTKVNASALSNYYTKTEADNAMSGRVDTFRASLNTELAKLQKALKVTELDLRHLDENTYYPVTFTGLHHVEPRLVRISRNLNQYPEKPTWAKHSSGGFSLLCEWIVNSSGWGVIAVTRNITTFAFAWITDNQSPLININQMTNSSQEYCYLRGGARYKVETHDSIVATIRTTTHNASGQSVAPMSYDASLTPKSDKQAVEAQITEERTARTNATTALTQQINTMNTMLNGQSTTISQQTQTINGISAVRAVTVDNNGVISGYGLMSELKDGRVTSQFGINADTFYIGSPSNNKKPFIFNASPRIIDGVSYPAGAWINSAYIAQATIQTAHIKDGAINDAKIANASIDNAKIKDLSVDTLKLAYGSVTKAHYLETRDTNNQSKSITITNADQVKLLIIVKGFSRAVYTNQDAFLMVDLLYGAWRSDYANVLRRWKVSPRSPARKTYSSNGKFPTIEWQARTPLELTFDDFFVIDQELPSTITLWFCSEFMRYTTHTVEQGNPERWFQMTVLEIKR